MGNTFPSSSTASELVEGRLASPLLHEMPSKPDLAETYIRSSLLYAVRSTAPILLDLSDKRLPVASSRVASRKVYQVWRVLLSRIGCCCQLEQTSLFTDAECRGPSFQPCYDGIEAVISFAIAMKTVGREGKLE